MSTDIAWAAGIFDGEGCIFMNRQRAATRKDIRTDSYRLTVKVTMGHRKTIERFATVMGVGTVHDHVPHGNTVNASYSWVAQSQLAKTAISLMRPFMITKAEEADLALAFFSLPSGTTGGANGNKVKSIELQDAHLMSYWRLRMSKSRWRFYRRKLSRSDIAELHRLGLEKT